MQEMPSNDRDFFCNRQVARKWLRTLRIYCLGVKRNNTLYQCLILKTLTDIDWCDRYDFAAIEELLPQDVSH